MVPTTTPELFIPYAALYPELPLSEPKLVVTPVAIE